MSEEAVEAEFLGLMHGLFTVSELTEMYRWVMDPSQLNDNSCPECGRESGHKMDCSKGRKAS